jgi:HD superfamily phosphohydrolase
VSRSRPQSKSVDAEAEAAKRVKDPIHDFIAVEPYALALLDRPELQRLRYVRQTGTAHLVYPGANHTRFEHSLGCHHLSQVAADALDLDDHTARTLGAATLLHDVGHGPFSHTSEIVTQARTGVSHEERSVDLIHDAFAEPLERNGIDPDEVERVILGDHRHKALVSGPLDVDRIDYLLRDGHYTGVATSVDALRLMATVQMHERQVVTARDGLAAAESLLVTRFAMHSAVYYHHTCRAGELLLERAMLELVDDAEVTSEELARMDDYQLLGRLRREDSRAGQMARRVLERRLPKVAFEVPYRALETRWIKANAGDLERLLDLERRIAEIAEVPRHHVQVDAPEPPTLPEVDARILGRDDEVRPLSEASTLVRSLASAAQDHWHFRVYAPEEHREAVEGVVPQVVRLEKPLDEFA